MTTKEIIAALARATAANRADRHRQGNMIHLSPPGEVIMTGDLHGHDRNFEKLASFADLAANPHRHLILHELLHCATTGTPDQCHSYLLVAQAALLKVKFPDQVHYLLGNHAMAQVTRDEVLKGGQPMVRSLSTGINTAFGDTGPLVTAALEEFIMSLPIAVRTASRVWMSHSLPSARHLARFDTTIFDRELSMEDMKSNGSLRALIWDRQHGEKCLEQLRQMWDVDMFVVGHQSQENGCCRSGERLIILASDHSHGCFLPFELDRRYEPDEFFGQIRPVASI